MGHYVITCDYLPDNPAHQYADEYHNVSITDKDGVLKLAQSLNIDGIMSFAVDPGVVTAAYVAEKMGLPAPGSLKSVEILQNKALFRQFLEKHGFNVPRAASYTSKEKALNDFQAEFLPVIVKPVDAAGSKGVTKVADAGKLESAIADALQFSNSNTFIIEEFIESKGLSSDCDGFSIDGKLDFMSYSGQRFDVKSPNPYTPSAYSWPASISRQNRTYLTAELQRLIDLLDMKSSVYNIEVREATDGKAYIMEVSPRGGGNRLSEMVRMIMGVDLIKRAVQATLGEEIEPLHQAEIEGYWAEIILYSNESGQFGRLVIAEEMKPLVKEVDLWIKPGDNVNAFSAANDAIGTLVLKFGNKDEMNKVLSDYSTYCKVVVK